MLAFAGGGLAVGPFIGWMSKHPFVIQGSARNTASWETLPHGQGIQMLEDYGRRLSVGQFPCKHPLNGAVAAIGRQLHATSIKRGKVETFRRIGKFLSSKVLEEISSTISADQLSPAVNKVLFDELLHHLPVALREEIWEAHMQHLQGWTPRDYQRPATFVKAEDSHKSDRQATTKPRAITVMPPEMYAEAFPSLIAQHLLYGCPLLRQWMTKGKTPNEVYDTVIKVISQKHRSQDISGFEKAMTVEMRIVEIELVTSVLKLLGLQHNADYVLRVMNAERSIRTPYYSYSIGVRCSGDFWTSLGNGLANICIILTGHYVKNGEPADLESWWLTARELCFVTEGDDALIPEDVADVATTMELMMELSLATSADRIGGADFLKNAFYPIFDLAGNHVGRLGNTLRWCRSLMFVTGHQLRNGKIRFLWRAKALSLLYLAPNHPMIVPLCYRIDELTRGSRWFKGAEQLSRKWGVGWKALGDIEKPFPRGTNNLISEDLRTALAMSTCPELPPISVDSQKTFEHAAANWEPGRVIQIPHEWRAYPEYGSAMSGPHLESRKCIGDFADPVVEQLWKFMADPPI